MLKFLLQLVYALSIITGLSCFTYKKQTNRVKLSRLLYLYNRFLIVATVVAPGTFLLSFIKGSQAVDVSIVILVNIYSLFEYIMVIRFYKKIGILRKSFVNAFNYALNLFEELSEHFVLNFDPKVIKLIICKYFVVDFLATFVKIYLSMTLNGMSEDSSWTHIGTILKGVILTVPNYLFNIHIVYQTMKTCVFKAMHGKLQDILNELEISATPPNILIGELFEFKAIYLKFISFNREFEELLTKFSTILFVKSFFNLLIQLVFIFMSFVITNNNQLDSILLLNSLVVALSEVIQIYSVILSGEKAVQMVRDPCLFQIIE
jgi:hypothetical protein